MFLKVKKNLNLQKTKIKPKNLNLSQKKNLNKKIKKGLYQVKKDKNPLLIQIHLH